jgi:hypothetical protein
MEVRDWKTWLTVFVSASVLGPANSIAHAGCVELVVGDVLIVPHGYLIQSRNQFVLYDDALRSATTSTGSVQPTRAGTSRFTFRRMSFWWPTHSREDPENLRRLVASAATGLAVPVQTPSVLPSGARRA